MNARPAFLPAAADPEAAFLAACALDVTAFKPGNVSLDSPGHGMVAEDFLVSAATAAPHLCAPGSRVGVRVYRAIEATRTAVGQNTNLGIVLLAAPLLHAAQRRESGRPLAEALGATLDELDREDADWAFRAILLAAPAGLGDSPRHDVRSPPSASLLEAMAEAAGRDSVARQYATGYRDVLGLGLSTLARSRRAGNDDGIAAVDVYLAFLAAFPDSHVARKHGAAVAEETRRMASDCAGDIARITDRAAVRRRLEALDRALKTAGVNPGTSADLTVATLLADRLRGPAHTPPRSRPGLDTPGLPANDSARAGHSETTESV